MPRILLFLSSRPKMTVLAIKILRKFSPTTWKKKSSKIRFLLLMPLIKDYLFIEIWIYLHIYFLRHKDWGLFLFWVNDEIAGCFWEVYGHFKTFLLLTCARLSFPESMHFLPECSFQRKLFTLSSGAPSPQVAANPSAFSRSHPTVQCFSHTVLVI